MAVVWKCCVQNVKTICKLRKEYCVSQIYEIWVENQFRTGVIYFHNIYLLFRAKLALSLASVGTQMSIAGTRFWVAFSWNPIMLFVEVWLIKWFYIWNLSFYMNIEPTGENLGCFVFYNASHKNVGLLVTFIYKTVIKARANLGLYYLHHYTIFFSLSSFSWRCNHTGHDIKWCL